MWGRTAGLLFAGPLVYFAGRGILRARLGLNLTGLFALGLSQAFVGWWMVRPGSLVRLGRGSCNLWGFHRGEGGGCARLKLDLIRGVAFVLLQFGISCSPCPFPRWIIFEPPLYGTTILLEAVVGAVLTLLRSTRPPWAKTNGRVSRLTAWLRTGRPPSPSMPAACGRSASRVRWLSQWRSGCVWSR